MRTKLFFSTLIIALITLTFSMLAVNLVFHQQFTDYLTKTNETAIEQSSTHARKTIDSELERSARTRDYDWGRTPSDKALLQPRSQCLSLLKYQRSNHPLAFADTG